jgi:hypothetical protein
LERGNRCWPSGFGSQDAGTHPNRLESGATGGFDFIRVKS